MGFPCPKFGYYNTDIDNFLRGDSKKKLATSVHEDKKDSLVGFIGGPPCPDFSIAGKNEGISGNNGKLTTVYKKLILQETPDFFLFENVKGLWKTKKHRQEYEKIKASFKRKGYYLYEKLINALEYGVPQDRDRIVLIGIHKNICKYSCKELKKIDFPWVNFCNYDIKKIKDMNWPIRNKYKEDSTMPFPDNIIEDLTIEYWFNKNEVYHHLNSLDFFEPRNGKIKMETIDEGDVSRKSFKRLHRWRFSPTVAYGNNEVHLHPYKTRRLTVAEALAIQSLPKEYLIKPDISLSDKFKTIANGVPFLMSKGIAESLNCFLTIVIDEKKVKDR